MTSKYLNLAISPTKADRLFWLGRYAERASLSLHLIRRYCNIALDQSPADAMAEFARRMGVSADTTPAGTFVSEYLYSSLMPSSIASVLDSAKNNAMLARNDIKSETLAYIEMAVNYVTSAKAANATVFSLQPVSDYLMAFWGAVEENQLPRPVRNILTIGRWVEKLDIMIRFDYDNERISDVLARLESVDESELCLCDAASLALIRSRAADQSLKQGDTLAKLNAIFAA